MEINNPVVALCAQGMRAEAAGEPDQARELFQQAWDQAGDDYEACVASHYLARHQDTPQERLRWNEECLRLADRVGDERIRGFHPSLHLNIAASWVELGEPSKAGEHYHAAGTVAATLPAGPYGDGVRFGVAEGLRTVGAHPRGDLPALAELVNRLCDQRDLKALALLLPAYLGDLGTDEDKVRLLTAAGMLHASRSLPEDEQRMVQDVIAAVTAG